MANADQVKALIKSHAQGDDNRFYSIALQVPRVLLEAVRLTSPRSYETSWMSSARKRLAGPELGVARYRWPSREGARWPPLGLVSRYPNGRLGLGAERPGSPRTGGVGAAPVRSPAIPGVFAASSRPPHRPPGTGKTLSASALAGELRLPLFLIRLDGLITKFMGETAAKLRLVFDALAETRGVYLFDEVDALGGERARGNDVGEIRRVLNSFLQFLEQDRSESLLIAATNHPQLLDRAMFRRFDSVIHFPLPSAEVARGVIRNRLATVKLGRIAWARVDEASAGLSHGEITLAAERAAKDAILAGRDQVETQALVSALNERHSQPSS